MIPTHPITKRDLIVLKILGTGFNKINQKIGGNVTNKEIPWWKLHEVANELNGKLQHITCFESDGRKYKRVVIEYEEQKSND